MVRRSIIYHGTFGTGFFQALYAAPSSMGVMFFTSLEYHTLVTILLFVFSAPFHFLLPVAIASLAVSLGVCVAAAAQAELPPNKSRPWSRALVGCLFFLQPIIRGWARYRARLELQ